MKRVAILLFLIFVVFSSGCATNDSNDSGPVVEPGDYISVNYTGRLTDGTVFDTSVEQIAIDSGVYNPQRNYKPLDFVAGTGMMIAGFDSAVIGMAVGDEKTVTIPPEEAYGPFLPALLINIPQEDFVEVNITPVIGQKVTYQGQVGTITDISGDNVSVDRNHRLAGETLVFTIEVVSIESSNA
ncbi:peptidylprolyl isomerase [Methanolobus sp. ZRKC3]|uniref:FKBP-type peptidyl-prolyl cis-trans isomerase n=1 Tax=Methanolobus sp. ZRKC3 TaxID=3125786 RepID=UPI00325405A0